MHVLEALHHTTGMLRPFNQSYAWVGNILYIYILQFIYFACFSALCNNKNSLMCVPVIAISRPYIKNEYAFDCIQLGRDWIPCII